MKILKQLFNLAIQALGFFNVERSKDADLKSRNSVLRIENLETRDLLSSVTLNIDDGAEVTNTRDVHVTLESQESGAELVRFALNGSGYGDWETFENTKKITIPSYVGANWVKCQVKFGTGDISSAYDSIKYIRPVLEIDNGADETNARKVEVSFSSVFGEAKDVRFKMNAGGWSDWRSFSETTNVMIPSYQGRNWVKAQIRYDDGAVAGGIYDSIQYVRPKLEVDNGAEATNTRRVEVSFSSVFGDAKDVRFKMNASAWSDWRTFSETTNVKIPSYQGNNWVKAQIRYDDGAIAGGIYDSIRYVRPKLLIEDGAEVTNTRRVEIAFSSIYGEAKDVRFKMNASAWSDWQSYSEMTNVMIPSYQGKNWVKAQIRYDDGAVAGGVFDSIVYTRPVLTVENGSEVTNSRMVDVSFSSIFGKSKEVRFAFNSGTWGNWKKFDETVKVRLPNYQGINWVKAQIRYESNAIAGGAYDSIDYFRSILVSAGESNIRFALNVQDSANEGFRDPELGSKRISAAKYALRLWSKQLNASYDKETIGVVATMDPMKISDKEISLGGARPNDWSTRIKQGSYTWYGDALANHLAKKDLNKDSSEIVMKFNSELDNPKYAGWYYGTDQKPGRGQFDFVTTVIHEIGHGMNFYPMVMESGAWNGALPGIYDHFLEDQTGKLLVHMTKAQRKLAITSNSLFWNGSNALAANDGEPIRLHAPMEYDPSSSVGHLCEIEFENELMSPEYDGPDHELSQLEQGVFADMGWHIV